MPLLPSAKKSLRRDKRRTKINLRLKKNLKAAIDQFKRDPSAQNLSEAYKRIDRTAKKNLIHPNKAARLKSSLSGLVKKT